MPASTKAPSETVRPPRVGESPVHLECVLSQIVELESPSPDQPNRMVIGRVTGIHIADECWSTAGSTSTASMRSRASATTSMPGCASVFAMTRPRWPR